MLHCGGNDLGRIAIKKLRLCVKQILKHIDYNFHAKVIWSEILPRRAWRYSDNALAMESCRKRINNYTSNQVVKSNGFYVKHPDMQETTQAYYVNDGVHLTLLGNCIFLNQLSSAIQAFQTGGVFYFKQCMCPRWVPLLSGNPFSASLCQKCRSLLAVAPT